MTKEFSPKEFRISNLEMICPNCHDYSSVFFSKCKKCFKKLIPLEFYTFFSFKKLYQKLKEDPTLSISIFDGYLDLISLQIGDSKEIILNSFQYFYLNYFYEMFLNYFKNIKDILKLDYVYGYDYIKNVELDFLSKKVLHYSSEKERLEKILDKSDPDLKDILFGAMNILHLFSKDVLSQSDITEERKLINKLIFDFLNEIIEKIKPKFKSYGEEGFENIIKFKKILNGFILNEEEYYITNISKFLDTIQHIDVIRILNELNLDLIFLPKSDVYVIIKRTFTPEVDKLLHMGEEMGVVSLKILAEKLKISLLESEIILQVLLKRKIAISRYSILTGELFYIRGGK